MWGQVFEYQVMINDHTIPIFVENSMNDQFFNNTEG
jgi:hypothetical protein